MEVIIPIFWFRRHQFESVLFTSCGERLHAISLQAHHAYLKTRKNGVICYDSVGLSCVNVELPRRHDCKTFNGVNSAIKLAAMFKIEGMIKQE